MFADIVAQRQATGDDLPARGDYFDSKGEIRDLDALEQDFRIAKDPVLAAHWKSQRMRAKRVEPPDAARHAQTAAPAAAAATATPRRQSPTPPAAAATGLGNAGPGARLSVARISPAQVAALLADESDGDSNDADDDTDDDDDGVDRGERRRQAPHHAVTALVARAQAGADPVAAAARPRSPSAKPGKGLPAAMAMPRRRVRTRRVNARAGYGPGRLNLAEVLAHAQAGLQPGLGSRVQTV
jgi:hypothetical protein